MYFRDRASAGKQLAVRLQHYRKKLDTIVLGLPRGGVVTAAEVAKALELPLDITCPRKIGAPHQEELAIGAVTETGEGIFNEDLIASLGVSQAYLKQQIEVQKKEAQRRLKAYRKNRPPRDLKGKTVIIVDDGLATGATMKAAIRSVQGEGVIYTVMAVPVAPSDTFNEISGMVEEAVALEISSSFYAVGQFYQDFSAIEDEEVIALCTHNCMQ